MEQGDLIPLLGITAIFYFGRVLLRYLDGDYLYTDEIVAQHKWNITTWMGTTIKVKMILCIKRTYQSGRVRIFSRIITVKS